MAHLRTERCDTCLRARVAGGGSLSWVTASPHDDLYACMGKMTKRDSGHTICKRRVVCCIERVMKRWKYLL